MEITKDKLEEICITLTERLNLNKYGLHIVAIFQDNSNDEIIGWGVCDSDNNICVSYDDLEDLYNAYNNNIAIRPHKTRGREVIKILESLGGVNADEHKGNLPIEWEFAYYIYGDHTIQFARIEFLEKLDYKIYTLEEYEQRKL